MTQMLNGSVKHGIGVSQLATADCTMQLRTENIRTMIACATLDSSLSSVNVATPRPTNR